MGKIEKIIKKGPVEGQTAEVYPVTSTKAVYDENNKRLDNIITGLQESVYLNTPIPISTENTPESMAQNVKNIADYVKKAKATGITDVNGMGVTCLIDDYFSGVGYIFGNTNVSIQGIKIPDDIVDNAVFTISNGRYDERFIVGVDELDKVTSNMLVQGARKPIILTPDTTEIDEETYQTLLSDNADVVFKTDPTEREGNLCTLTYGTHNEDSLALYFTCLSIEGIGMGDLYTYAYEVDITKTSPHTCSMTENQNGIFNDILLNSGYVNESTLNPILQQINLTGTDADRKAKLDQFEADWKALTGANNLYGARFVGTVGTPTGDSTMVFTWNDVFTCYTGVGFDDTNNNYKCMVQLNGTIRITPLFSHLEAVVLRSGSDSGVLNANKAAIKAYIDNIQNLGIDPDSGYIIPIKFIDRQKYYYGVLYHRDDTSYFNGIVSSKLGNAYYNFTIDTVEGSTNLDDIRGSIIFQKDLSEINVSLESLVTCVKFTETSSSNKSELDKYLVSVPNATVMHCTYKDVYAGTLYKINNDWYGLLVKNTNNPVDNINIKLSADGTIVVNSSTQ